MRSRTLWADDPSAYWAENTVDPDLQREAGFRSQSPTYGDNWRASKRVLDRRRGGSAGFPAGQHGRSDIQLQQLHAILLARDARRWCHNRYLGLAPGMRPTRQLCAVASSATANGTSTGGPTTGTMIEMLRLVE